MCASGVPGGKKENGEETFVKRTMNFREPMKDTNPEIQEGQNLSSWTNKKKAISAIMSGKHIPPKINRRSQSNQGAKRHT